MKNLKQIRENYDALTNKDSIEDDKLTMLARAGLLEEKRIPLVKRGIAKDAAQMTPVEKKALNELLDSLMMEIIDPTLSEAKTEIAKNDYLTKFDPRFDRNASERDLPYIIVLKRKAIRVYPDNQKVGLYYSQALDRYVSIPWDKAGVGIMSEEVGKQTTVIRRSRGSVPDVALKPTSGPWGSVADDEAEKKRVKRVKIDRDIRKNAMARVIQNKSAGAINRESPHLYNLAKKRVWASNASGAEKVGAVAGMIVNKYATKAIDAVKGTPNRSDILKNMSKSKISESFREKLQKKRQIKEYSASQFADDAADVLVPGYSSVKKVKAGDYWGAAKDAAIDAAAIGAGALTLGAGYGAIKGAQIAGKTGAKLMSKAGAKAVTKGAATGAGKVVKGIGKAVGGAVKLAGAAAGAMGGDSDSDGSSSSSLNDKSSYSRELKSIDGGGKIATQSSFSNERSTDSARRERERQAMFREENLLSAMKKLAKKAVNESATFVLRDGEMTINNSVANKVVSLYESVNKENKKKINKMLNENVESFKKIVDFAVRQ